MRKNRLKISIVVLFLALSFSNFAQVSNKPRLSGSFQSDILFPESSQTNEALLTNTYLNVSLSGKLVNAGARFEYLDHPLPGYENDFKGYGVPFFYVSGNYQKVNITLGSFYEQFGSGLVFRTYEERSLGIDNSLLGAKLVYKPIDGLTVKLLSGRQRRYFDWNKSVVSGADLEVGVGRWMKKLSESETYLTLGGSFVTKHEKEEDILIGLDRKLNLPENVGAFALRGKLQKGDYNFLIEYAWRANDPSFDNGYIYKSGSAILASGSYSKKGISALLQAKRSENMSYRSRRSITGTSSFINHLPAFTQIQTYALTTIYPYATQTADGEWAFQGELAYQFKKKTALGGEYGTKVKLNISHIRSIDKKK